MEIIYTTTFNDPTALDPYAVQGYMIVQNDNTIIIDAFPGALEAACNACCDGNNAVAKYYTSNLPTVIYPSTSPFCIQRVDAGGSVSNEDFNLAYLQQILGGGIVKSRNTTTGVSSYDVTSYTTPIAIGTDVVTAGACA